jgi:hypothetical protein
MPTLMKKSNVLRPHNYKVQPTTNLYLVVTLIRDNA